MREPPKGVVQVDGRIKIAVCLPRKLFNQLCERARKEGATFSETISDVAECGLLDIEESEKYELSTQPWVPGETNAE